MGGEGKQGETSSEPLIASKQELRMIGTRMVIGGGKSDQNLDIF